MFTGYELVTDKPKPEKVMNFETWTKFSDPFTLTTDGYDCQLEPQVSLFDIFFIMDTSKDECLRRAMNRTIDSALGNVYHSEDNPAPEDPKLAEKLKSYYGDFENEEDMIMKLDTNHIADADGEIALRQFVNVFGKYDVQAKKGLKTCVEISTSEKVEQEKIYEKIEKSIDDLLSFKQIAEDRTYAELKQQIKIEELDKEAAEAAAAAAAEAAANSPPVSPDVVPAGDSPEKEPVEMVSPNMATLKHEHIASKTSLVSHPVLSHSKMSQGGITSKRHKKIEYTREYKIKLWEEMESNYFRDGLIALSEIKKQNETVVDSLNQCQRSFIQFLERPCQKQEMIDEFVNSFNKFSEEFPDLRKDEQTKEELMNRLQTLSDNLW